MSGERPHGPAATRTAPPPKDAGSQRGCPNLSPNGFVFFPLFLGDKKRKVINSHRAGMFVALGGCQNRSHQSPHVDRLRPAPAALPAASCSQLPQGRGREGPGEGPRPPPPASPQPEHPWPPTPGARPPPLLALMPGEPHLSRPLAKPGPSPGLAARGRCAFPRARALRLQRRLLPPRPALGLKAAGTQSSVPADPGGRSELQEVRAVAPRGTLTCRLTWTPLRASSLPVATVLADQPPATD